MGNSGVKQHCEVAQKTGTLNLSQRKLVEFPQQLGSLASCLRTLDISDNKFSKLPPEISKFTLLKNLNVSGNRLVDLPESLHALVKLEIINASSNKIDTLPSALSKLTHLKQVTLVISSRPLSTRNYGCASTRDFE